MHVTYSANMHVILTLIRHACMPFDLTIVNSSDRTESVLSFYLVVTSDEVAPLKIFITKEKEIKGGNDVM